MKYINILIWVITIVITIDCSMAAPPEKPPKNGHVIKCTILN